jgi:hypothetical protein
MPDRTSRSVEFPAFREYEAVRQEANNAMMALLAGSRLAAHTLQLTTGSTQLLPDIFPGVDHLEYFRLRTDAATALLRDTGHHLGAVAVPYALAIHEDFVQTTIELLGSHGFTRLAPGANVNREKNAVKAWNLHEAVYLTLGVAIPSPNPIELEHFHLLREMRNSQIHNGGKVSDRLRVQIAGMSEPASNRWFRLGRRNVQDIVATDDLAFTVFDIFAVFATTKALGRVINGLLREHLTHGTWADICLHDYAAISSKPPRSDRWARGLLGHGRVYYGSTGVTPAHLLRAAVDAGAWIEGHSVTPRRSDRGQRTNRNPGALSESDGE